MRFAVFADLHLETIFASVPMDLARRRRMRLRTVLETIFHVASNEQVDAVFCAGDLYEHDRFSPDTGEFLRQTCGAIAPIPVLFAPGNHDWLGPESLYAQVEWPTNVHLFESDRLAPYELTPGLTIWGAAHRAPANTDDFLRSFHVDRDGINVAVFHGSERSGLLIQGEGKQPHAAFYKQEIQAAGLHFAFVGHYHTPTDGLDYAYPGNPEPLAFGEPGTGGLLLAEVSSEGAISFERRRVAETEVRDLEINVDGAATSNEVVSRCKEELHGLTGIVRVTLSGEIEPEVDIRAGDIEALDSGPEAIVVRFGRLTPRYDINTLKAEPTVRGQFVRDVLEADLDEGERRRVMVTGLRAFDGRTDLDVS